MQDTTASPLAQPAVIPVGPALFQELRATGYVPGPPAHLAAWARTIDQGVCRRETCSGCGGRGLAYQPYHKGRSYRIVAACSRCGHAEEF